MKISIKTSDKKNKYMTHIVVNGIDLGMYASGYQLKQEPGEITGSQCGHSCDRYGY